MPKALLIAAVLSMMGPFILAAQQPDANTGALLVQIESGLKKYGWDKPGVAVEVGPHGLQKIEAFVELQKQAGTAWPQIVANIQNVAPTEERQAIILMAFESSLTPDQYLQFVDQVTGLVGNKVVDKQFLLWALFPTDKNMRQVFAYNYDKPVVKDILSKVKALYPEKPGLSQFCDSVLSGAAKQESEAYLNDNPAETRPKPASNSCFPT